MKVLQSSLWRGALVVIVGRLEHVVSQQQLRVGADRLDKDQPHRRPLARAPLANLLPAQHGGVCGVEHAADAAAPWGAALGGLRKASAAAKAPGAAAPQASAVPKAPKAAAPQALGAAAPPAAAAPKALAEAAPQADVLAVLPLLQRSFAGEGFVQTKAPGVQRRGPVLTAEPPKPPQPPQPPP